MPNVNTPAAQPELLAGRYRLGEQIAVGGSARVVAAIDERLGRRVAVKLVDAAVVDATDPAARQRFVRESRASAGFSHPHAVAVYDAGEDAGLLYLVMELVDGPSVAQLVAGGPLPIERAVRIAEQVLAALEAAHASGVVHRDVKPANVLITPSGDAKLADFGIAKRFDDLTESVTRTGFVVGTPRYLAPEQALGRPLTPASDVYAVGVLLYEMLAGVPPYDGATATEAALAHQVAPVPDVTERRPDVPPAIAAAVARALAKDPADRFQTARAMASALRRSPTGTQVMPAVPPRAADRPTGTGATRTRPDHRWLVVATVGVLVLSAVAAVVIADDDDVLAPGGTSPSSPATTPASTAPTTVAPTTVATVPPTTVPPVPEVIPGFPATDDVAQFLAQVEANPSLVGPAGEELAEELAKVLEEGGRKQADRADELLEKLDEWAEEEELAPEIVAALQPLLVPLADQPGRDGDGDE
jgi:eukaryotic-like serine/threonine-protein kinase